MSESFPESEDSTFDFLGEDAATPEQSSPIVLVGEGEVCAGYKMLSYSSCVTLHKCPRKFQLSKLRVQGNTDASQSVTFAYGHAVGDGIQNYLITRDLTKTIWHMFCNWPCDYFDENEKQKKSLIRAIAAIQMFADMVGQGFLDGYEVATYNGKPAAELAFRIDIGNGFKVRGYLDLAMRNPITDEAMVLENKTDSGTYVNAAKYKNSAQGAGYSVVLDKIESGKSSYTVQYLIQMTKLERYETFDFAKSYSARAAYLRDLVYDKEQVEKYVTLEGNYGNWPMRGESCMDFGKPCEFMDICQLDTQRMMMPLKQFHLDEEAKKVYQFDMTLAELLESVDSGESLNE